MRKSEIKFGIELDGNNVPEKITWDASEKPVKGAEETKAILMSIWDEKEQNTLRMDLWTKEMSVDAMKQFCVNAIGGMADTIERSTNDGKMSEMIHQLCRELVKHLEDEAKKESN